MRWPFTWPWELAAACRHQGGRSKSKNPAAPASQREALEDWSNYGATRGADVCFSNRPSGVKRFQTIHHLSVNVARGLVLLFGIGTKALPSWDSKTRWNNLSHGLTVRGRQGPSGHANSPHPTSREGHHSTTGWSSSCPSIGFDPVRFSCCCRGLVPGPPELSAVNPYAV